jgi:Fic family protein
VRDATSERAEAWQHLNELLAGTPYLFPNTDYAKQRAYGILMRCLSVQTQFMQAQEEFSHAADDVRSTLEASRAFVYVHESNAIENSGFPTLTETHSAILGAPSDLDELRLHTAKQAIRADTHLLETLGLRTAMLFAETLVSDFGGDRTDFSEVDLRSLHQLSVGHESYAGEYRTNEAEIVGMAHRPLPPEQVKPAVTALVDWINRSSGPGPLAAAVAHAWLTHIHPFEDGNGRVARLLATVMMLRSDFPSVVVKAKDKLQYIDALSHSDEAGDIQPFVDLFVKSAKATVREFKDPETALQLIEAEIRGDHVLRYELWSQYLETFMETLRDALHDRDLVMDRMTVPTPTSLSQLERRDSSGNSWLAKVNHASGERHALIWLGYLSDDMALYADPNFKSASIFLSVLDVRPEAPYTYIGVFDRDAPASVDLEIAIQPTPRTERVVVRRHSFVDQVDLQVAAYLLADALANLHPHQARV